MILRHLYHRDLAQASYLLGCAATGEAMIVDPNRDIEQYIDLAEREGLQITAITETHIHADYVSGARELALKTGAKLFLSDEGTEDWKYPYASDVDATLVHDGDQIILGNIRIDVMHTPGHTPEHISFLVTDGAAADKPMGIFTGDFVFVGDVGRPDLLEKAAGVAGTMEDGARQLFRSLQRFKELPDFVQIWPGHGAGSACGKALGAVPQSTVGYERLFNWAFQIDNEDAFVEAVLADQPEPPFYFAEMKRVNKVGPALVSDLEDPSKLPTSEVQAKIDADYVVVDVRSQEAYAKGHIPGTINIPFAQGFVTWAGWLVPYDKPFFLIADKDVVGEIASELRMIGLDNLEGFWPVTVNDELAASGVELGQVGQITVDELANATEVQVIDVRGLTEYEDGHIPGSENIPVGYLRDKIDALPDGTTIVLNCQTGRRSAIAASVALAEGKTDVRNLIGGFEAWKQADKPIEAETLATAKTV
jgi:hydroxyacylglutathione hydrolase